MIEYDSFLSTKRITAPAVGVTVDRYSFHPLMFEFQRDVTVWGLRKGRGAFFTGTGTGKTIMQLEWAKWAAERTLILAPLAVAKQTVLEGERWNIPVTYARSQCESARKGITISNYEMLSHFDPTFFGAVVLDESSILKSFDGKVRTGLIETFRHVPMRLCCTATPAPNDIAELANHAEFLGLMSRAEMLATFFVHDENGWRLKGHAEEPFYRWLASWALTLNKPSDIGYSDRGFILPKLTVQTHFVESNYKPEDNLFMIRLKGITDRGKARKATVKDRIAAAVKIIEAEPDEAWLIWCGLNDESDGIAKALGAIQVKGKDSVEHKEHSLLGFAGGKIKRLVSKASIAGFGMNFQKCARVLFLGLNDSWESYYQAIRRCWRFGQTRPVNVHVVLADIESEIFDNVQRKEKEAIHMHESLVNHMAEYEMEEIEATGRTEEHYEVRRAFGTGWEFVNGDSSVELGRLENESVDLSVFSPPFATLFTYSNSERDLGNSKGYVEFWEHLSYISKELLRVIKPGRHACVHVQQLPTTKSYDGVIGMRDFRGDMIRHFVDQGFVYHGEVCIDKDPQAQAIRTKSKSLLFVQLKKDSSWLRPAFADYILIFRKPGDNLVPIHPDISNEDWIQWARPIWYGIRESDTLHVAEGREEKDERHICPLQLGTIERCIRLWSNRGELVLSPFGGIGSEGYEAIRQNRRFHGIELKTSYWSAGVKNLRAAEQKALSGTLFEGLKEEPAV